MLGSKRLSSHYFHIIGDGHQPNSRGLYTHYKDSPEGWMTIPNTRSLDPGSYDKCRYISQIWSNIGVGFFLTSLDVQSYLQTRFGGYDLDLE